ncbi:MAG: hypothetical protein QY320_03670 [Gammaproteobacteria bacterium]|nr:MAG: hypothetical protein QY320_03670 [Gammaproteobacteria bacterium]
MSNYNKNNSPPGSDEASGEVVADGKSAYESALRNGRVRNLVTPDGRDMGAWDSYRRWLNRVQQPDKRRTPIDPALYTWKGYRNWSDKVRRDWKQDE